MKRLSLVLIVLISALVVLRAQGPVYVPGQVLTLSTADPPESCVIGNIYIKTTDPTSISICGFSGAWVPFGPTTKFYAMPDAANVNFMTMTLATDDTACGVTIAFSYFATDGTNTVSHGGDVTWSVVNQNGTLTGATLDFGEVVAGTGCAAACDTWSTRIIGQTATLRASFDNTLSASGSLTYSILNNSCPAMDIL